MLIKSLIEIHAKLTYNLITFIRYNKDLCLFVFLNLFCYLKSFDVSLILM